MQPLIIGIIIGALFMALAYEIQMSLEQNPPENHHGHDDDLSHVMERQNRLDQDLKREWNHDNKH